jgi:hypothetical protein
MHKGAGFISAPLFVQKGSTMPGIRLSFIRDEAQEQWVDAVEKLQPATDTTYIWNSEQIKADREGLRELFDRFIDSTGLIEDE